MTPEPAKAAEEAYGRCDFGVHIILDDEDGEGEVDRTIRPTRYPLTPEQKLGLLNDEVPEAPRYPDLEDWLSRTFDL